MRFSVCDFALLSLQPREQWCKYSHIPMTVNQELLLDTKRVQRQYSEITLTLLGRPPQNIDNPTLQQPQKVCLDANLGIKAHRWVPGRTPTVHRCPQAKAVGGPRHDPQSDKCGQPKDIHHCLSQHTWWRIRTESSSAQPESSSEHNVDTMGKKLTDSLWAVASNRDREQGDTLDSGHTPGHSGEERGVHPER